MILNISSNGIGAGKDAATELIQKNSFLRFQNKKYAEPLKQFVVNLIGCRREQLEDHDFKASTLGPEWSKILPIFQGNPPEYFDDRIEEMTVRELLIGIGDGLRKIIHPDIWINAAYSNCKALPPLDFHDLEHWGNAYKHSGCMYCKKGYLGYKRQLYCKDCAIEANKSPRYPDYIFSDHRYPNEGDRGKTFGGYNIRIVRPGVHQLNSPSERSLDNYKFDFIIENSGTLADLEDKIKTMLAELNILRND